MKRSLGFPVAIVILLFFSSPSLAFWIWTPESGKWVNPKYAVKETPQDHLAYARNFLEAKDYKKARDEFQKLLKHYPRAREAAEAQYYIGLSQENEGQSAQAFKSYQVVIQKYPFSERSGEIIKRQYEIGNQLMEGKDSKNKFVKTVVGGDYDVIEVFRAVIKNAPYGEYAAPAQYKIGLYLLGKAMHQEARDEFEKTINDYPSSEWAKAAKYQIALADAMRSSKPQYDQKITASAVNEFKDFLKEYPDAELSQQAQGQIDHLREKEAENYFVIAEFYEKQKQPESAKIYYTTIVEDYKNTSWAPKALTKIRQLNQQ